MIPCPQFSPILRLNVICIWISVKTNCPKEGRNTETLNIYFQFLNMLFAFSLCMMVESQVIRHWNSCSNSVLVSPKKYLYFENYEFSMNVMLSAFIVILIYLIRPKNISKYSILQENNKFYIKIKFSFIDMNVICISFVKYLGRKFLIRAFIVYESFLLAV